MTDRIDYQLEKYSFTAIDESPRLTRQWADVLAECQREKAGSVERVRIALLNVDYVTSFELPFRLLLLRTPQYIGYLRDELALNQRTAVLNGKKRGRDLNGVPDAVRYRLSSRITRSGDTPAAAFQQIANQTKLPRERVRLALEAGLQVNGLDGLFWLGCQRIAADIAVLRNAGMKIVTSQVEVFDSLTGTTRIISVYHQ